MPVAPRSTSTARSRTASLSFLVAFAVSLSGITSASALARGFGGDYLGEFVDVKIVFGALLLLAAITLVNLRGIAESVKLNVGFTLVEIGGLLLIVLIAVVALFQGDAEPSRAFEFKEGSVDLRRGPRRSGARVLRADRLRGLGQCRRGDPGPGRNLPQDPLRRAWRSPASSTSWSRSALAPSSRSAISRSSDGPLLEVVKQGPLGIPEKVFSAIGLLALSNGALINMIMASRLLYGMASEDVVPRQLGIVGSARQTPWVAILFITAIAARADHHRRPREARRHDRRPALVASSRSSTPPSSYLRRDKVDHEHFQVPVDRSRCSASASRSPC